MYIFCVKNNFVLKVRIVEVCLVLWQKAGDPAAVFRAGPNKFRCCNSDWWWSRKKNRWASIGIGTQDCPLRAEQSSRHVHVEGRAGNMFVAPFDDENVVSRLQNRVSDVVLALAEMLDHHFFAGAVRADDSDHQNVLA